MTSPLIACAFCEHFNQQGREQETCKAFPDGIPAEILSGENNHTRAVDGDNGIRFTPIIGFEHIFEEEEG